MSETHCANCGADLSGVRIHACCNHPCRAVDFPMAFPPDPIPGLQAEIARLTAALAQSRAETQAALAGCVKIKPLVWFEVEKYRHGGKYTAEGYTIRYIEGLFILDFVGDSKSVWRFPPLEAAKAAAQADYEARILAAIQPDTSKLAHIRDAIVNIVNHDAFQDEEYMSEDLIAKLNAARAALTLITAQEDTRHD